MDKKIISYSDEARKNLHAGIEKIFKAVGISLGPKGRYALIDRKGKSLAYIDDGVTIAKEICLSDPMENTGASMIKESSLKTNDMVGDGTSTSTVLAYAIINEAQKYLASGFNPIALKNGIKKGLAEKIKYLKTISKKVETRDQKLKIANISCLDLELADLIVDAVEASGDDGYITIENGTSTETTLEVSEGLKLNEGWVSPYFANTQTNCVLENCLVVVTDHYISSIDSIIKILEIANKENKPVFIISYGIAKEPLATMIVNKVKAGLKCGAMKAVGYGEKRKERFQDISILTGSTIVSQDFGMKLENISLEMMGLAKKIVMNKSETVITADVSNKEKIDSEIKRLKREIQEISNDYMLEHLETRIACLSGKVAIIKVGGNTESEITAKKMKIEDAKNCLMSAIKDGVVPGGGISYLHSSFDFGFNPAESLDEKAGLEILSNALKFPVKQLVSNSGYDGNYVAEKLLTMPLNWGFDVTDGQYKCFDDLIIDPVMVEIKALEHAVSIACQFICTECVITTIPA